MVEDLCHVESDLVTENLSSSLTTEAAMLAATIRDSRQHKGRRS
jgi:hypothetical protein